MSNIQVPSGQAATIPGLGGADASNNAEPLSSLSATISSTTNGFLSPAAVGTLAVVNRGNIAQGAVETVTVTLNGNSQNGTALPALPESIDLLGPPAPPQATHIVFGTITVGPQPSGGYGDPGTATVKLI